MVKKLSHSLLHLITLFLGLLENSTFILQMGGLTFRIRILPGLIIKMRLICIYLISYVSIFSYTCWPFVCHLCRNVYSHLVAIFQLGYELQESLYILTINYLSDKWFVSIFSHSVISLFTLFIISYAVQKLFSLMSSQYLFLLLWPVLLVSYPAHPGNHYLNEYLSQRLFPYVFFQSVIDLDLSFKSLICFELIVVCAPFLLLSIWIFNFPNTICSRDYPLPIMYF